jgi:NhaA family Na+:H+ antiporter
MDPRAQAPESPPELWSAARRVADAIAKPIQSTLAIEATSGLLLLAASVAALIWANSGWGDSYRALWHLPIGVEIGGWEFSRPLEFWINEGLMTIFFFLAGLEIRREIYEGELSTLRTAVLPVAAAAGGMLVPAGIFVALNYGRVGAAGWAIPMATDIAFAVGVLTLLGSRVPSALRVQLLALAVIDDLGAILIIAVFFSTGLELTGFGVAGLGVMIVLALRWVGVRRPSAFVVPAVLLWWGLYRGGVHPTIAGVVLGLMTPARSWFGAAGFSSATQEHLRELDGSELSSESLLDRLDDIEHARKEAVSPAERLIHVLHPWVAYGIMPVFALANAGVVLGGVALGGDVTWLFVGIVLALAVGKPLGIYAAMRGMCASGLAARNPAMTRQAFTLIGLVGGIGFTMSLFIAHLAFPAGPLLDTAKLAILVGSGVAILAGLGFGAVTLRDKPA